MRPPGGILSPGESIVATGTVFSVIIILCGDSVEREFRLLFDL